MTKRNRFSPAWTCLAACLLMPAASPAQNAPSVPPAPVPPAPVAAPPTSAAAAGRDAHTLNPLLVPTDTGLRDGLAQGREIAKEGKDFIDLLTDGRRAFAYRRGGLLGEKRRETGIAV